MIKISVLAWSELPATGLLDTHKADLTSIEGESLAACSEMLSDTMKKEITKGAVRITVMITQWTEQ